MVLAEILFAIAGLAVIIFMRIIPAVLLIAHVKAEFAKLIHKPILARPSRPPAPVGIR